MQPEFSGDFMSANASGVRINTVKTCNALLVLDLKAVIRFPIHSLGMQYIIKAAIPPVQSDLV